MQIIDCFLFNDELDLLRYRLDLLDPVVDRFVLVESTRSFSGLPKAAQFREHRATFADHLDKLTHVVVDLPEGATDAWERERLQHAAVRQGLAEVDDDDLVLVSDVDEVPRPEIVRALDTLAHPTRLVLRHSVFFANWELPTPWIDGPMACRGRDLGHPHMGIHLGVPGAVWNPGVAPQLADAGLHLSYLGGRAAVETKFQQFSHQELNNPLDASPRHLERCIRLAVHYSGRSRMRPVPEAELDPMLLPLVCLRPDFFDFAHQPRVLVAETYRAFVRLRRSDRLVGRGLRAVLLARARRRVAT